ncbi:hypothetical protein PGB90_010053 [Kerria lacca]
MFNKLISFSQLKTTCKTDTNFEYQKELQIKGQMVNCGESDSLLFLGAPALDGLESLTSRGLFISDIPLHDATRDVILVGEQARAQFKSNVSEPGGQDETEKDTRESSLILPKVNVA